MKRALLKLMMTSGFFAPFRLANRSKALILTYHRFGEGESRHAVSRNMFAKQLRYLTKHYKIVSLSELVDHLAKDSTLPRSMAAITIDDGYRDAYEIAYPVLKQFDVPATIFVVTGFLDGEEWIWTDKMRFLTSRTGAAELSVKLGDEELQIKLDGVESRFESAARINGVLKKIDNDEKGKIIAQLAAAFEVEIPKLPPNEFSSFDWRQAREMDANRVSIESHTVTHPILTYVNDERLQHELNESRKRLENELSREVEIFCYPNGDYNERVRLAVKNAGYGCAVTTASGFNEIGVDVFSLNRLNAEFDMTHFTQTTSGFELVKNKLRV